MIIFRYIQRNCSSLKPWRASAGVEAVLAIQFRPPRVALGLKSSGCVLSAKEPLLSFRHVKS
jgi:hypothetical protein